MKQLSQLEERCRGVIHEEVRRHLQGGGKMHALAVRAGVNQQTVSRIFYGETASPRFRTMIALLESLGYRLELRDVRNAPRED